MANWRSHLSSRYRGRIEYVFVVEDERDQACAAVRQFQGEFKVRPLGALSAPPFCAPLLCGACASRGGDVGMIKRALHRTLP